MANPNAPFGFKPYRHLAGGIIRASAYKIADVLAANIFFGDAVKSTGAGRITVAAAGNTILGIFAGVNYVDVNGNVVWRPNWVTGTDLPGASVNVAEALVYDDPFMTFMVMSNVSIAETDIGDCTDLVATAGDSTTGISKFSTDTPQGATATFKLLRWLELPVRDSNGNPALSTIGANTILEVKIVEHENAGTTSGVAV